MEGVIVVQDDGAVGRKKRTGPCFTAKELWREIISSEVEYKPANDPEPELNARSPVKVKLTDADRVQSQSRKKDNPKDKPKDQLPADIIRRFGVLPKIEGELRNTNTREEWDRAVEELKLKAGYGYGHTGEAI